jgi:CRP-like cAMP-binding protein
MIKRRKPLTLKTDDINYLKAIFPPIYFNVETELIYIGQVPKAAYILLEGELQFLNQRNNLIKTCERNSLIGFHEINNREAFCYTVKIKPGTKLIVLDRSTIKEILNKHSQIVSNINLLKAS